MDNYSASEVFQFALKIEENGEKFYRELSKVASVAGDEKTKNLFDYLANEEVTHGHVFEDILSSFESYEPADCYPDEYFAYLKALSNNMIFEKNIKKEIAKTKNIASAIKLAIKQEGEAILYYQEIKKLVSEKQHHLIDAIIDQERIHFLKLTELELD